MSESNLQEGTPDDQDPVAVHLKIQIRQVLKCDRGCKKCNYEIVMHRQTSFVVTHFSHIKITLSPKEKETLPY